MIHINLVIVSGIPDSLDSIVNVFHWSIAARQKMTVSSVSLLNYILYILYIMITDTISY